jgi:putative membrane protein
MTHIAHVHPVEHVHPSGGPSWLDWLPVVLPILIAAAWYATSVVRVHRAGRSWPPLRTASWTGGLAMIMVALSPPVASAAHADVRLHMAQHLLLGMAAPLGLVLAAPVTLLLRTSPTPLRRRIAWALRNRVLHVLSHPVSAAILTVGALYLLYLTPLYQLTVEHAVLHQVVNAHFLVAGCLYVWAIAGPDPAPRRPGLATRVAVLVLAAGAHGYLAKLLYARAGESGDVAQDVAAMEQAAQWMYYGGDLTEILLAVALFAAWSGRRSRSAPRVSRSRLRTHVAGPWVPPHEAA